MDVENRACGWRMYSYGELRIKRLSASEEGLLLKVKLHARGDKSRGNER
jgi:hypothetical protein